MAFLYINSKGAKVTFHSYSAGQTWRYCKRRYFLERVMGWREREKRASMSFGNCIEGAIAAFYLKGADIVGVFEEAWAKFNNAEMVFTDKEKDWARMLEMGRELLRLFRAIAPALPIARPRFSVELRREFFPGTKLAGINHGPKLDIISSAPWEHPLLVPVPEAGRTQPFRPLVIDVKTAAKPLPADPRLLLLDPQLRDYAWATGIADVAFLNLVKSVPEIERGDTVREIPQSCPESERPPVVLEWIAIEPTESGWMVTPATQAIELDALLKGKKGKVRDEARSSWIAAARISGQAIELPREQITKAQIQFLATRIPPAAAEDEGSVRGQEVVEICAASERDFFPMEGGIRWPNDKCLHCPMQPVCIGDEAARDATLYKADETWLDVEPESVEA